MVALLVRLRVMAQRFMVNKPQYFAVWDIATQCPSQVVYVVSPEDLGKAKRVPSWRFLSDIPYPFMRARHSDYTRSGYQRGHLCPAADRSSSKQAMRETFCLSNVAPQLASVNVGTWKQTENWVRSQVINYDSLCVLVCPVYLQRDTVRIGKADICVPHAFFKAVWVANTDSVLNAWFIFNK